jgi:hypothetical protein
VGLVYVWVKGDLDWVKASNTAPPLDVGVDVGTLAKPATAKEAAHGNA